MHRLVYIFVPYINGTGLLGVCLFGVWWWRRLSPIQLCNINMFTPISKITSYYKINMANQRGQDLSGSRGLPDWGATSEHLTGVRVAHNRILHAVCCLNFRTRPFFSFKPLHLFKKIILVHLFRAREMCNQSQHTPRRLFSKLVGTFYLMFQQHVSARCTKNRVCRRSGHSRAVLPLRRERR